MKITGHSLPRNVTLSTVEGYPKDKTPSAKKRFSSKPLHFSFSGDDAPLKAVKALMQKYGIEVDDL